MRRLTRRQRISAAALTALALFFISLDFAGGSLSDAHGGASGAMGSLYRGSDSVIGPLRRFVQGIPDVGQNRREIADLKQENAGLQRQLTATQADAATAKELARLQLQSDSTGWQLMPAKVIATTPSAGFEWTVTIDVGSREHVVVGQTVTDGVGLVGRIVSVHSTTSTVLLVCDPTSGVGVRDTRTGGLSLAKGSATNGLTATPIDGGADLKVGDQLVTGPAGKTTYAPGVVVGQVAAVHRSADGTVSATVRPTGAQTGLNVVGVVLQTPRTVARQPITPAGQP